VRCAPFILALLLAFSVSGTAHAENETLQAALEGYGAGELDTALQLFAEALGQPGNQPADLEEIHCHLGILHAVLGQDADARRSFEICLSLNPQRPSPPELGPDQRVLFDGARAARGGARMEVRVQELGATAGRQGVRLRVRATNAPADVVAGMVIRLGSATGTMVADLPVDGAGEIRAIVPCEAVCPIYVEARDSAGGVLMTLESAATLPPPIVERAPRGPDLGGAPPPEAESRSVFRSPWFWVVTSVVVAGGITAGVMLTRPDSGVLILAPVVE